MRDGSDNVLLQAYYGTQYIDEVVALKLQHRYAVVSQDANYNVVTLTDLASRVLERVFYTEYGQPIIECESTFGDYDGDGDLDSTDSAAADTGGACRGSSPSGACRVLDTDQDGDVDGTDYTTLSGLISAAPTTNHVHHARRTSPAGNIFLHQGLVYDAEIAAYQNRAREYSSTLQRFQERDPLLFLSLMPSVVDHYAGGLNLYEYVRSGPLNERDPSGFKSCGSITCGCDKGGQSAPVHGGSWLVVPPGMGCITTLTGIYCRGDCEEIFQSGILKHECCHWCALTEPTGIPFGGLCKYLGSALPGIFADPYRDGCTDNEKPYTRN